MKRARLLVDHTWDGQAVGADERVRLELTLDDEALRIDVDAPYHGDPPPPGPPGACEALWEYEVAELFLVGERAHYLELELGPLGHHLVLRLEGVRNARARGLPLDYAVERRGRRWHGRARVPVTWLPAGLHAANAFAMHGLGAARRHLAAHPVGGDAPDFHRIERFPALGWR